MIKTSRLIDLSEDEFEKCRELTFRSHGLMEEEAVARRLAETMYPHYRYTMTLRLYEGDEVMGWCLMQPVRGEARWLAYFYVNPLTRKRGYGSLLFKEATKYGRFKIAVKPDYSNRQFFERFDNQWVYAREDA